MVRLNSIEIESSEIDTYLKQELKLRPICNKVLHQRIIAENCLSRKISLTEAEIEAEANRIRSALHLEKASDTLAWLTDNLIDPDQWELAIRKKLLSQKLAKHLFESKIESYFAQHRLDYDRFLLYQLVVPYEKLAQELFYQVEEEEISFYQAAHLYDIDARRRYVCGYEGEVHRWDYAPDVAAAIFKTPVAVGELIGPISSKEGYHLFRIEDYLPAQLTPELQQEIMNKLFEEWLNSELNYLIHRDQIPATE